MFKTRCAFYEVYSRNTKDSSLAIEAKDASGCRIVGVPIIRPTPGIQVIIPLFNSYYMHGLSLLRTMR